MRNTWMIAGVAALALAAAGCTKGSDSSVVAKVNQTKITAGDFKRQLEGLDNFQMEQAVASDAKARKEFLEDLVGIELVTQEAKRQGLDKEAEFKKTLESLKKDYEDSKKRLDRRYQDAMRNELFKSVLKKELSEKASKLAPPSDKEVREFYDRNRDKMVSMDGKRFALKEVEPQIRQRLMQEKQRDLYLQFVKGLREKAKVTIDEDALNAVASSLTGTATLQIPVPKADAEKKGDAKKK